MAFPSLLPIPTVQNVAAGAVATIRPQPVGTYFALRLFYARAGVAATVGQIASDILSIKVMLDGVPQWELTGAQLQAINAKNGILPDNGEIPLWFTEPKRVTEAYKDARAWGMVGISDFTVEVTIDAAAVTPSLRVYRYWSAANSNPGEIRKLRRATVPITVVGDNVLTDLRPKDRILGFHCISTIITAMKVKVAEQELVNAPTVNIHSCFKEQGFVPQVGYTHLSFDSRDRVGEACQPFILSTVNGIQNAAFPITAYLPFEVTFTTSAATPFTMVQELVGPRD